MQSEMNNLQQQVTSGMRVERPSDDPAAVGPILQSQARIAQLQQNQTNLGQLQTELSTGDGVLQQAITAVESAITLASQSSSLTSTLAQQSALLQQAQGIQEALVHISATSAGGRYIFSGDLDQQALYVLDSSQPTGVRLLAPATSTRTVTDANGYPIWTSKTATDIFDARNPDNSVATGNVFAAVNSLVTALQANDSAAALASISSLKAADDHLNQQLGYYGIAENRVSDTVATQSKAIVDEQQKLSGLRDTNIASAALQLSQLSAEQQAALTSRAKLSQLNLFDFLA